MGKNTGEGYRKGSVDDRTQVENTKTGNWVKRNREEDGEPFKGVAQEPDERRRTDDDE